MSSSFLLARLSPTPVHSAFTRWRAAGAKGHVWGCDPSSGPSDGKRVCHRDLKLWEKPEGVRDVQPHL